MRELIYASASLPSSLDLALRCPGQALLQIGRLASAGRGGPERTRRRLRGTPDTSTALEGWLGSHMRSSKSALRRALSPCSPPNVIVCRGRVNAPSVAGHLDCKRCSMALEFAVQLQHERNRQMRSAIAERWR